MFVALGVLAGLVLSQTWDWINRLQTEANIREQSRVQREKQEDFDALKLFMRRKGYGYDPRQHTFYDEFQLVTVSAARRLRDGL